MKTIEELLKTIEELLKMLNKKVIVVGVVATGAALWWFRPGQKKYNMPPSPYWTLSLVGNFIRKSGLFWVGLVKNSFTFLLKVVF